MELFIYIRKLIEEHDFVVIPGFGGFLARYEPARIHPVSHELRPPNKALAFNRNLTEDDGLLLSALIKNENIDPELARKRIEEFSSELNQELEENKMLSLPGIGKIVLDLEGRVRFIQDEESLLLPQSFGLPVITASPILRQKIIDTQPAIPRSEEENQPSVRRLSTRKLAAAAILLGILLITALFTVSPARKEVKELMGWSPDTAVKALPDGRAVLSACDIDWMMENVEASGLSALPPEVRTPYEVSVNHQIPKGYFIVVGSFARENRAKNYAMQLKKDGWEVYVFPQSERGFHRVAIYISDSNPFETSQLLREIRSTYQPDAWVVLNE